MAAHYLKLDCTPKDEGPLLMNPELAATLRAIAKGGVKAFYSGLIAEAIVDAVRSHPTNPGRLSLQDLASYTPKVREPICGPYRGLRICGMPPESSGTIAVLQTLGILEHFDVAKLAPNSLDAVHLISEAYRLAYADRQKFVGDPDFLSVPVAGLLDAGYLKQRSTLISMDKTMGVPVAGNPAGAEPRGRLDASRLALAEHVVFPLFLEPGRGAQHPREGLSANGALAGVVEPAAHVAGATAGVAAPTVTTLGTYHPDSAHLQVVGGFELRCRSQRDCTCWACRFDMRVEPLPRVGISIAPFGT